MDCKKLSVIIPVYGTEKYLKKCLESVLNAIDDNVEVIIINDGSPDNSEIIIEEYLARYPNVFQYYKKENGGLSDTKNYGLERCHGDFVIFLDSDDYIEPNMYTDMLQLAMKENADIVACDIFMDYEDGRAAEQVSCRNYGRTDVLYSILDTWLMPASWNKMIRRELYKGLVFPKGLNNEDVAVTPIVLAKARKIVFTEKPYYHYLQRKGSIQNSGFNEKRFVILDTVKLALDRMNDLSNDKRQMVINTLFLHQVLAMAMYPIREIKNLKERERLLTLYMDKIYDYFPNFMETPSFKELIQWGNKYVRAYRKKTLELLGEKKYHKVCLFWSVVNVGFAICKKLNIEM